MSTILNLVVDQKHSYIEALRIAYDKALREGGVDEETKIFCEYEFSKPSPAAVYHESDMEGGVIQAPDGGCYFKSWGLREVYEQARINSRRCIAQALSNKLDDQANQLVDQMRTDNVDVPENGWSYSINEAGALKITSPMGALTPVQQDVLTRLFNQNEFIRRLALDYAERVASLASFTLEGLSAPYARHFSSSTSGPGSN
jgi:hypothetical protein